MQDIEKKIVRAERVRIEDAELGMIVSEDIKNDTGGIIVASDSPLRSGHIEKLKQFGITSILVKKESASLGYGIFHGMKVVIADDTLFYRHMFAKMLYRVGMHVCEEVEKGNDCIRAALRHKPQLVVVELDLPDMSGANVISKLKKKLPKTKFIVVSTNRDRQSIRTAMLSGANDYLIKPVKWDLLKPHLFKLFNTINLNDMPDVRRAD